MRREDLTQEELKKWLDYNPETGRFTWIRRKCGVTAGKEAGCFNSEGYHCIRVNGWEHKSHRLAFLWMEGALPKSCVDHINEEKSDNRWENLRLANRHQNNAYKGKQKNNTSGYKGVSWKQSHQMWCARIQVKGKPLHLGYFEMPWQAHEACKRASEEHFGEFAHDGETSLLTKSDT